MCYYLLFLNFVQLINNNNNNRLFTSGFWFSSFMNLFFCKVCTGYGKDVPDYIRYKHSVQCNHHEITTCARGGVCPSLLDIKMMWYICIGHAPPPSIHPLVWLQPPARRDQKLLQNYLRLFLMKRFTVRISVAFRHNTAPVKPLPKIKLFHH